jgi:SAM-dependent methyltransferase
VRAVDIDPSAIERGTRLQQRYRVTAGRIEWQIADVERLGGAGEVSAFTLPADGPFDLIICFRFLPRRFLAGVGAWLSPGGTLLLETFSPAHAARFGRPASRERVLSVEDAEAIAAVAGLRVIRCEEAAKEAVETTRLHAIRT